MWDSLHEKIWLCFVVAILGDNEVNRRCLVVGDSTKISLSDSCDAIVHWRSSSTIDLIYYSCIPNLSSSFKINEGGNYIDDKTNRNLSTYDDGNSNGFVKTLKFILFLSVTQRGLARAMIDIRQSELFWIKHTKFRIIFIVRHGFH